MREERADDDHANRTTHRNENRSTVDGAFPGIKESSEFGATTAVAASGLTFPLPTMMSTSSQSASNDASMFGAQESVAYSPVVRLESDGRALGGKGGSWVQSHSDALLQYAESVVQSWTEKGSAGGGSHYYG